MIAAVRDGRTVAMDMDGRLYGNGDAVRLVREAGFPPPARRPFTPASRTSIAAAVAGLLLLALL